MFSLILLLNLIINFNFLTELEMQQNLLVLEAEPLNKYGTNILVYKEPQVIENESNILLGLWSLIVLFFRFTILSS